jgi:hypothetical protein
MRSLDLNGCRVTTPRAEGSARLLGAVVFDGVALTLDEMTAIRKLYGFKREGPTPKPEPPEAPKREDFAQDWEYRDAVHAYESALKHHENWEDPRALLQAGSDRNAIRHAKADGLRILAWLAKNVPAGDDPLKSVIQLAIDAGWDVDPSDIEWAEGA